MYCTCWGQHSSLDTGMLGRWQGPVLQMIKQERFPFGGLYVCMASSRQLCEVDIVTFPLYLRRNCDTERFRHLPKVTQGRNQTETWHSLSLWRAGQVAHLVETRLCEEGVEGHSFIPSTRADAQGAPTMPRPHSRSKTPFPWSAPPVWDDQKQGKIQKGKWGKG